MFGAPEGQTLGASSEFLDRFRRFGCGVHQPSVCATMDVWPTTRLKIT